MISQPPEGAQLQGVRAGEPAGPPAAQPHHSLWLGWQTWLRGASPHPRPPPGLPSAAAPPHRAWPPQPVLLPGVAG